MRLLQLGTYKSATFWMSLAAAHLAYHGTPDEWRLLWRFLIGVLAAAVVLAALEIDADRRRRLP